MFSLVFALVFALLFAVVLGCVFFLLFGFGICSAVGSAVAVWWLSGCFVVTVVA